VSLPATGWSIHELELSEGELAIRYRAYRRRQARGLLHMLPREAVRPLYRRALAANGGALSSADPMELLVELCERLLPLPSLEAWLEDVRQNPEAHLNDVEESAEAPSADAPVTVESRRFAFRDEIWSAHLRSFRDGDTWRGFIAFEDPRSSRVHRTALIFREPDAIHVRERFLGFEPSALVAFLRSSLP